MEKSKVFLTGANGFLGGYLSERLIRLGYEVHGLTQENKAKTKGVIPHRGDLLDYARIGKLLGGIKPQFIVHLAARTEVEKSFYDPIEFSAVNYVGTVNLIEKAKKLDNLKLFLFSSTMETYGEVYTKEMVLEEPKNLKPFDEDTKQYPNAPYAVAKVGCEYYLEYAKRAYKLPVCTLRQTNTYGRWDNDFFVVEQIITQMLKNPKEINLGYKEPWRNFLFVDDLMDLYVKILANWDDAEGQVFCTGPDNALPIEGLANIISQKLDWHGIINWDTKRKRAGEIYYLNSTPRKAKDVLGWEPRVSLDEGLDRTIKIWKEKLK